MLLNEEYVKNLSKFENLYIGVSLKGTDTQTFERITGGDGVFFHHQLIAYLKIIKHKEINLMILNAK